MKLNILLSITLLLKVTVTVVSGKEEDVTKQNYPRLEWFELPSRQTPSPLNPAKPILGSFTTPNPPPPSSDSCKCVANYLCKNKTIITDGEGMFDLRFASNGKECPNVLDVCCDNSTKNIDGGDVNEQYFDEAIWEVFPLPPPPPPPLDRCICVPYYLCKNKTIITDGEGMLDMRFASNGKECPNVLDVCCDNSTKNIDRGDVNEQYFNEAIWEVFPLPPPPPPPLDRCICVPYYLCKNKTIITDGEGMLDMRLKEGSCPNYFEVCCYEPIQSTMPSNISYHEHHTICGQWNSAGVEFKLTGHSNNEAQFGEFPWMMAILNLEADQSKTYLCSGSLIHPNVVLTVAHCVFGINPNNLVIRAGEWDSQTENEPLPLQDGEVSKIITHEKYHNTKYFNDLSLIIVTQPFLLRKNVGTLCLPSPNYVFDKKRCYASGWGKTKFGKSGIDAVVMKKVDLPVVSRSSCLRLLRNTRLSQHFILHKSFICAGGEIGKDICQGDGGSPLMCPIENRPNQFQQAGIVAWGIGCNNETPGVYVNVASFRNWIDEQMAQEKLEKKYYDPEYVPTN